MEESNELTEFQSALNRCLFGTIEQRTISRKLIEKLLEEQLNQGQKVPVAGVVGRSEQFICGKQDVSSTHQKCNAQCDGCKPRGNHSKLINVQSATQSDF